MLQTATQFALPAVLEAAQPARAAAQLLSKVPFNFAGKRKNMSIGSQHVVDPYLGGWLSGKEVMQSVHHGAFRSGLVGYQVTGYDPAAKKEIRQWYEIRVTKANLFEEVDWEIVPIDEPDPGAISRCICDD